MQTLKKHKNFNPPEVAKQGGFLHRIRVPWEGQPNYMWNEACADIHEVFGLPGNRFMTNPQLEYMDFYFKSEKDAALCKILLSDKL